MTDEGPIDLSTLDASAPGIAEAVVRRFRWRVVLWTVLAVVAGATLVILGVALVNGLTSAAPKLLDIDRAPYANTEQATYTAGRVQIGLRKVASIGDGKLELDFLLYSDQPLAACCSLQPVGPGGETSARVGPGSAARFSEVFVVVPDTVGDLFDIEVLDQATRGVLGRFTVDLAALGVRT